MLPTAALNLLVDPSEPIVIFGAWQSAVVSNIYKKELAALYPDRRRGLRPASRTAAGPTPKIELPQLSKLRDAVRKAIKAAKPAKAGSAS